MTCGLPSAEDLESIYWASQRQYVSIVDDSVVFSPDAPKRVIDSYNLWKSMN